MVDWDLWLRIGLGIDVASGFVFLAFGLFVGFKRPRTRLGKAGMLVALGFALMSILGNIPNIIAIDRALSWNDPWIWAANVGQGTGVALIAAGCVWLARLRLGHLPRNVYAWTVIAIGATGITLSLVGSSPPIGDYADAPGPLTNLLDRVAGISAAGLTPLLLWTALSIQGKDRPSDSMAMALVPFAVSWNTIRMVDWFHEDVFRALIVTTTAVGVAMLGFARQRRPGGPPLFAWAVGWMTIAFLFGTVTAGHQPADLGLLGMTRILAVGMLGYAVVRHRAFDIDITLRFTLRQSTVAGIFVAVFVGVQAAVGEYVTATAGIVSGAAATATLVFGLGPLQRFGERVAAAALPNAVPLDQRSGDDRIALYRALATEAWSDGSISAKEARVLELAWRRLGLTAEQAHRADAAARIQ